MKEKTLGDFIFKILNKEIRLKEKKKKFCSDCIYLVRGQTGEYLCCASKNTRVKEETWYEREMEYKEYPHVMNENNDCLFFSDQPLLQWSQIYR